jgi:predicted ABC-type ATPase
MGSLLVVTGPPGAGKSTVSRLIADRYVSSVLVEGDAFFAFLRAGAIEPWLPESHQQNGVVTDAAAASTASFVAGGYDTVYDGVMGPWFLPAFARRLGLAEFDYVVLFPSFEECVERVRARVGHGFSDEAAARSMHEQFAADRPSSGQVIEGDRLDSQGMAHEVLRRRATGDLRVRLADL